MSTVVADAVEHLVRGIVANPDDVRVDLITGRRGRTVEVHVQPRRSRQGHRSWWAYRHRAADPRHRYRWPRHSRRRRRHRPIGACRWSSSSAVWRSRTASRVRWSSRFAPTNPRSALLSVRSCVAASPARRTCRTTRWKPPGSIPGGFCCALTGVDDRSDGRRAARHPVRRRHRRPGAVRRSRRVLRSRTRRAVGAHRRRPSRRRHRGRHRARGAAHGRR